MKRSVKGEMDRVVRETVKRYEKGGSYSSCELKGKLEELSKFISELEHNYSGFKEEVFKHILDNQDHKRWMYQIDDQLAKIINKTEIIMPGTIHVSH